MITEMECGSFKKKNKNKNRAPHFLIILAKFPSKTLIGWAWVTCLFLGQLLDPGDRIFP